MPEIIIADSGSTKTNWLILDGNRMLTSVRTGGLNPYFLTEEEIQNEMINFLLPHISVSKIEKIFFYGAGCSTDDKKNKIVNALHRIFPGTIVQVEHDMTGVARALFGQKMGIACILGTGSNACLYDGNHISIQVPSFGYLWGDQGSGSYLGKKWAEHYFYKTMPEAVCSSFEDAGYSVESILSATYSSPTPNRYLASLAPIILQLSEYDWVKSFIEQCFNDFIDIIQFHIPNHSGLPIGFSGSVAYHFRNFLISVCEKRNIPSPIIISDPMPGLIQYHEQT
jgi:N-acetylglucosamine kinase-like BadF-type ATPase